MTNPLNDHQSNELRFARFVLSFSMFVMGACGMIYEYALGVLGNNIMGSSHEQLFVIIGLMMFAMGIGATIQQRIVDNLIDRFLVVEITLGLIGGLSTLIIFCAFAYTDSYRLVMYSFAMAIGMLIGCEIPLLIRINQEYSDDLRTNLSTILSMDYVGSLAGALLFTYVLLTRLSVERISLTLGCVNIAIAIGGLGYFWPKVRHRRGMVLGCVASLAILFAACWNSPQWIMDLEQRCYEDPIVHRETSKYQHLVLTKRKERLRLYIDGHLQFSSEDEFIYHELLVHVPMTLARARQDVLILGGGDGLALREVLLYGDVKSVTLVDIDPAMTQMAAEQPEMIKINQAAFHDARVSSTIARSVSTGERIDVSARTKRDPLIDQSEYRLADVHVMTVDADLFLRDLDRQFDVVLVDFPDPRSIELAKLYSVPFYRTLRQRLKPNGIASVQSTSPTDARRVFRCIGATLEEAGLKALPFHQHVPSFGDWGWYLVWDQDAQADDVRKQIDAIEKLSVRTRYITPELIRSAFVFGKGVLNVDEPILPNTRWNPIVMHYHARDFK